MLLTFDCYGTLIDWETGILDALRSIYPESAGIPDDVLGAEFHLVQNRLKTDEYRTYRDLLTQAAQELATGHGWDTSPSLAARLPASVPTWQPFEDTNRALRRLRAADFRLGILSNIDDDLLTGTLEHLDVDFDHLGTAQRLESYKPGFAHFRLGARWAGASRPTPTDPGTDRVEWLHVAQSLFHDILPAAQLGLPAVWVNRRQERLPEDADPLYVAPDLDTAVDWILEASDSAATI